ncbi:unnamed protein product [Nippostrongylus brasiliensis]|uniref:Secreted protein n=1 Tax=Nippostrongylus brasiliensis TaxID=27835 RepID=A0A0N4YTJ4_NIPBR|nr:unnamed protein product [Nippostrongylus brasiliensis]
MTSIHWNKLKRLTAFLLLAYQKNLSQLRWTRLLRIMTLVLTFLSNISNIAAEHFGRSVQLRTKAHVILFRLAQKQYPPNQDLHRQLSLFMCKETVLLRVHTIIQKSALPPETTIPILLSRKSYITSLYILYINEKNQHSGTELTLT